MKTNQLGKTELYLSQLGLGTWAIGGSEWGHGWGPQDKEASTATIIKALELGINWIDTAPIYGNGISEEVIGQALKETSLKPILATKCGLKGKKGGKIKPCLKKESIYEELHASLKRLKVDTIDLYQIHWPKPDEDIEEAYEAIQRFIKEGKIRYGAVSNFNISQMKRVSSVGPISSLQSPLNLLDKKVLNEELSWCIENSIGFLAYSPLACGVLTGKVTPGWLEALDDSDWRKKGQGYFSMEKLEEAKELIESLRIEAANSNLSLAQAAISWVVKQAGVTSTIVGARRPGQIVECVKACSLNEE